MANFVSYANATDLMTAIGQKFATLNGAYVVKGNSTFEALPSTLTASMNGFVYNITNDFTTTSDFVEGAGRDYPAGTNVAIVNLGDAVTPNMKFDVIGSFIDVDALEQAISDVSAMITAEFDATNAYAIGDIVTHDGDLYTFTSAHTANDPWDATEVSQTTVVDLLSAIGARVTGVNTRVSSVVSDLAPEFDASQAYAIDDVVVYGDGLYIFTNAHTAGDPWDSLEVSAVTISSLISAAEPNELTSAQITTLIALL